MMMPVAPYDAMRITESLLEGAVTTGSAPKSAGRTTPATSPTSSDTLIARGSLLSRAWRIPARLVMRPKVAARATC